MRVVHYITARNEKWESTVRIPVEFIILTYVQIPPKLWVKKQEKPVPVALVGN